MAIIWPKVKPALVLDLDGTVRYSKSGEFIKGPGDVALFPGVEERIWEWRRKGFFVFGVSNQGGVAFGLKTVEEARREVDAMRDLFEKDPFHIVEVCFFHPDGPSRWYGHRSLLRKPDYGMLVLCEVLAYAMGHVVDWENSLLVGDRQEDLECARRAGIGFRWAWEFFGRPRPDAGGAGDEGD